MTRVLSSSYLTSLWFILVRLGASSLAAEAPGRVVVSFRILEDWWARSWPFSLRDWLNPSFRRRGYGYSFDDEEVVNEMPFFSWFIFDHFSYRLNIVEPEVFLRFRFECGSTNQITVVAL